MTEVEIKKKSVSRHTVHKKDARLLKYIKSTIEDQDIKRDLLSKCDGSGRTLIRLLHECAKAVESIEVAAVLHGRPANHVKASVPQPFITN